MASEQMIQTGGVQLAVEDAGEGVPVVLLHGLTATRRYVVMGSRVLERSGHRVISYDARGHGRSSPAPTPDAYSYAELCSDLEAVLDAMQLRRVVLAGASMGAHTLLRYALAQPERVAGIVAITPAYGGDELDDPSRLQRWDALAEGLRRGGVEGFLEAYGPPQVTPAFQESVIRAIRQRLALHQHPEAVADALMAVPRCAPFGDISELRAIDVPAAVVASNDEADPGHPFAVGEAYASMIPGAVLVADPPGSSPIAWQGSRLSHVIADIARAASAGAPSDQAAD